MKGNVYFLGAGPGDPELLTRKAWRILSTAEVVLYDALVPSEILRVAQKEAILCDVGKRCGQKSITQEEIHALLVGYAAAGWNVVRLQGGDPLVFGRVGEEIAAVREAGINFEIVPGVTAASAAAAAAQIPLTDRRVASKVIFLSAHRRHGRSNPGAFLPSGSMAGTDATLVIYMPGSDYASVAGQLAGAGLDKGTPCVIVSKASTPEQSICRTDLATLAGHAPLPSPALLIVGGVAASRVNGKGEPVTSQSAESVAVTCTSD